VSASNDIPQYATEDDLYEILAADVTDSIVLPNGKTVEVRGLTRAEHLWIGKGTDDAAEIEARMLSKATVRPALNLSAAKRFQETAPSSVVAKITARIRDLSGFGEGAQKSAV
jgi:hypothetical protein